MLEVLQRRHPPPVTHTQKQNKELKLTDNSEEDNGTPSSLSCKRTK